MNGPRPSPDDERCPGVDCSEEECRYVPVVFGQSENNDYVGPANFLGLLVDSSDPSTSSQWDVPCIHQHFHPCYAIYDRDLACIVSADMLNTLIEPTGIRNSGV